MHTNQFKSKAHGCAGLVLCCLNGHRVLKGFGPLLLPFSALRAVCIAAVPFHRLLHHALLYPVNAHCSNNTHPPPPPPQTNSTTHRHWHSLLYSDSKETEHLAVLITQAHTPPRLNTHRIRQFNKHVQWNTVSASVMRDHLYWFGLVFCSPNIRLVKHMLYLNAGCHSSLPKPFIEIVCLG